VDLSSRVVIVARNLLLSFWTCSTAWWRI